MSQYSDLQLVTDHTAEALALLIDQYQGLPRLTGLITAITNRIQELEDTNWDVLNKRLLDYTDANGNPAHAVAQQLDTIGKVVGQGRNGQDDATYLLYIRARIFLNHSSGLPDEVIALMRIVEPATFIYREYPTAVWILFTEPTVAPPLDLVTIARLCVAAGVQLNLEYAPFADSDAFSYCSGAVALTDMRRGYTTTGGTDGGFFADSF